MNIRSRRQLSVPPWRANHRAPIDAIRTPQDLPGSVHSATVPGPSPSVVTLLADRRCGVRDHEVHK